MVWGILRKEKLIKKAETFSKKYFTNSLVIALVAVSVFISILYLQLTPYAKLQLGLDQQLQFLEGKQVEFGEPNNTGLSLLIFNTHKIIPLDYFVLLKMYEVIFFVGFLLLFYNLVKSIKLTILTFAYPPLLINTILLDTSLALFFYTLPLYLYLKGRKTFAYLCSIPLVLIRHEGLVLLGGFLLYEFISEKRYKKISAAALFFKKNAFNIILVIIAAGIYMYLQNFFFGHPLANFMLNAKDSIAINLPFYMYIIRWFILFAMLMTSIILFKYSKLLFAVNTLLFLTYSYFAIFGFEYTLFAIQAYFSWMFLYFIIGIGYLSGDINNKILFNHKK